MFDKGHKNEGQLREVAKRVLIGADRMVNDVLPGDDQLLPPLQAADLSAFELRAEARALESQGRRLSRYPLVRLDDHPHELLIVDSEGLKERIGKLVGNGILPIDSA